jgi:hypothetical protein
MMITMMITITTMMITMNQYLKTHQQLLMLLQKKICPPGKEVPLFVADCIEFEPGPEELTGCTAAMEKLASSQPPPLPYANPVPATPPTENFLQYQSESGDVEFEGSSPFFATESASECEQAFQRDGAASSETK